MEKYLKRFAIFFVCTLLFYLLITAFIPVDTNFSRAAALTPLWMKLLGLVSFSGACYVFWMVATSRIEMSIGLGFLMLALVGLCFALMIDFDSNYLV